MTEHIADVAIVGAGVIGTSIAWRCAQRGLSVALADPEPRRGAWHTAAGMLAPITELHYTEAPLLRLGLDSLARFAAFAAELEDVTELPIGLAECGTVAVAWDAADLAALRDLHAFAGTLDIQTSLLTGRELRELEPALAAGLPGALLAEGDHQVDPRLLHAALAEAGRRAGVVTFAADAAVRTDDGVVVGLELPNGDRVRSRHVVLAAGAWSGQVAGVPREALAPVRPVKGQTVHLRLPGVPRINHVVRAEVRGSHVYLVPRSDGRIVVGASVEEAGFDVTPRAGAVYELLRDAQSVLPELSEAVLEDVSTGLRPGSPDNAPLIGPTTVDGLIHATGHYRNGVLLAPITAYAVAEYVVTGAMPDVVAPFSSARFRTESAVSA